MTYFGSYSSLQKFKQLGAIMTESRLEHLTCHFNRQFWCEHHPGGIHAIPQEDRQISSVFQASFKLPLQVCGSACTFAPVYRQSGRKGCLYWPLTLHLSSCGVYLRKRTEMDVCRTAVEPHGRFRSRCAGEPRLTLSLEADRKSTRLNSSHSGESRMPSSA